MDAPHVLFLSAEGLTEPYLQAHYLPALQQLSRTRVRVSLITVEHPQRLASGQAQLIREIRDDRLAWYSIQNERLDTPKEVYALHKALRLQVQQVLKDGGPVQLVHARGEWMVWAAQPLVKQGTRLLWDARRPWLDDRLATGLWQALWWSPWVQRLRIAERNLRSQIALPVVGSHSAAERLDLKWPVSPEVIPNGVDSQRYRVHDPDGELRARIRQELRIPSTARVLAFSSSLRSAASIRLALQVLRRLLEQDALSFLVVYSQRPFDEVEQQAASLGVSMERIRFRRAPRLEMPINLAAADFSLVLPTPSTSPFGPTPQQALESWAVGVPIIGAASAGDMATSLAEQPGAGLLLEEPLTNQLYGLPARLEAFTAAPPATLHAWAARRHGLSIPLTAWAHLYASLLNRPSP